MSMITCVIIDDESLARQLLRSFLQRIPDATIIAECKNASELSQVLEKEAVDLIFMDIQMPGQTGMEFLKSHPNPPLCILTTAYPQYAIEGFELNVCDYLLKPFTFDRFSSAFDRAQLQITSIRKKKLSKEYLLVKGEGQVNKINFDEISYIEGMREYVAFHTDKQRVLSLMSLKSLEELLPANLFMRVHKSFIVAVDRISKRDAKHVYLDDKAIPVGGSYKSAVKSRILLE